MGILVKRLKSTAEDIIDVPANQAYQITSIQITNNDPSAAATFDMHIIPESEAMDDIVTRIVYGQSVAGKATYTHSLPEPGLVLESGDRIAINNAEPDVGGLDISTEAGRTIGTPDATLPYGLRFKPDGLRVFIMDGSSNDILQYDLDSANAWNIDQLDLTTADGRTLGSPAESNARDCFFKPDGNRVFITGVGTDDILQYDLDSAWNINSFSLASTDGQTTGTPAITNPYGLFFKPDGLRVYLLDGAGTHDIVQYDLDSAWNIDLLDLTTPDGQTTGTPAATLPTGMFFDSDGTRVFITDDTSNDILQYDLDSAWNINNFDLTTPNHRTIGTPATSTPGTLCFKPDGNRVFITDYTSNDILQYNLDSAWDVGEPNKNLTNLTTLVSYMLTTPADQLF
jgi:DNA-binding beta-propeller fold protein YncE